VLGAFAGVAMALFQGAQRTNAAYPQFVREKRAADVVVAGKSNFGLIGAVDLDAVERLPDVAPGTARAYSPLPFSLSVDGRKGYGVGDTLAIAAEDDRLGNTVEGWKMLAGRRADPNREDEATASFDLARKLHLHVGSTMRFHFYDAQSYLTTAVSFLSEWPQRLDAVRKDEHATAPDLANGPFAEVKIVGIEASPLEFPPLVTDLAPVVHLTPAFAHWYEPRVAGSPVAYIRLKDPSKLRQFQLEVEQLAKGQPVSFISTLQNQQPKVQRGVHAEAAVLMILGVLVALAGAIALAQAIARQSFLESRDDDTLRALGMERRQLLAVSLLRASFIAVCAALVAGVVGWLVSPLAVLSLAQKANLERGFPFDERTTLLGAAAVVLFTFMAAGVAELLLQRTARRSMAEPEHAPRRLADSLRRGWLPVPALLGARFALQRGRRSAPAWFSIAGIAFCVAVLTFASTFTSHLHRDLSERRRHGWNWDVKIGVPALPDIVENAVVPGLRSQPGVTGLSAVAVTQIDVGTTRVDVLGLEQVVGDAVPTIIEGRNAQGPDEIVLGTRTMHAMDTGLGRIVSARIGSTTRDYRVVGRAVFPEFGDSGQLGTGAMMTFNGLKRVLPTATRGQFFLRMENTPDARARTQHIIQVLTPLPFRDDARPEDLVNLSRGDGLLLVLAGLLALLAFLMLVHTVMTAVRGSRQQHATLRAIGFSRRQCRYTILWQSLTLAFVAILVGIPLGLLAGRASWAAYARGLGLPGDAYVPVSAIVIAALGTLIVSVIASIPPGWLAAHTDVPRTLRAAD
jgi:ABC-type lipoprotein release transport system permease subunit